MKTFSDFLDDSFFYTEEYKKLPRLRMARKAVKRILQAKSHGAEIKKSGGEETTGGQVAAHKLNKRAGQFSNIVTTLLLHNPKESKSREEFNRNRGLAKKKIKNLLRIDQNRRTLPVARMRAQSDRLFDKGHYERSGNVDDMRMSRAQRNRRGYTNPEIGRFKPKDED